MNYQDSLNYLESLTQSGIKLGLENTARLLEYFGNPQLKIPAIHIAGTNGKGSTAAFTESILRTAGYRVGLYTSPHLLDFRERIQINRVPIGPEELIRLICQIRNVAEALQIPVTYFEFATVIAFLYFSERQVDWNVIEVGLGGRLDATNLCRAEISILTSISRDHEQYLGTSLQAIAFEKASIIKNNGTVFAASQDRAVMDVISKVSHQCRAKVNVLGKEFKVERISYGPQNQVINFCGRSCRLENLVLPLIGRRQVSNAALAVAACLELNSKNRTISEAAVRRGLETTRWEGRLEVVAENPTIIVDGAHNRDSVNELTKNVQEYFDYNQCILVLGIMKDKRIDKLAELLSPFAHWALLVKLKQERSLDPCSLLAQLKINRKFVKIIAEIPYALQSARKLVSHGDIICVTGSLFTVAETKKFLATERVS
ncbi:MAG: bifunctional folylpolyglutamate synthase/dihydrofolate synthase [Nitrospinales bacterium]